MMLMDKDAQISRFWEKYTAKARCYGVKEKNLRWYVRHVEAYIKAHHTRLALHTPAILNEYLNAKCRNIWLKDWVFSQIVDALRILFVDLLESLRNTLLPKLMSGEIRVTI